jgi:hypothetical protein
VTIRKTRIWHKDQVKEDIHVQQQSNKSMTTDTNGVSWEGREKKRKICHKVTTPVAMIMIYEDDFRVCQYLQIKTQDGNHNIMMFNPKREHLISSMMLSLP